MKRILESNRKAMRKHLLAKKGVSETTKIHFLTFANTSYMKPTRILEEIEPFMFDSVRALTEHDIPEFIEKHKQFFDENQRGFGCWLWKPRIILDRLLDMEDNELLVYCDAGMHMNSKGIPRYCEYLELANSPNTHILAFSANPAYLAHHWIKADAIYEYFPEFWNQKYRYRYAGVMILKKTAKTIELITDWLGLCENYDLLTTKTSINPEHREFYMHDYDNALFNLCLAKHNITTDIFPDETNVYNEYGQQNHMFASDWSPLDRFPFQTRRLRPR